MSYTLSIEGDEVPYHSQDLSEALAQVAAEHTQFVVLTRDASEEYIQAAGAHGHVIVERRERVDGAWRHVKLAHREGSLRPTPPMTPGFAGYQERELFVAAKAAELFHDFVAGRPIEPTLIAIDLNHEPNKPEPTRAGGWLRRLLKR